VREEYSGSNRNRQQVIDAGPEEVLFHLAHGRLGQPPRHG
jgi:hypothetical protein